MTYTQNERVTVNIGGIDHAGHVATVSYDRNGYVLGYIILVPGKGSFYLQRKAVGNVGYCANYGRYTVRRAS